MSGRAKPRPHQRPIEERKHQARKTNRMPAPRATGRQPAPRAARRAGCVVIAHREFIRNVVVTSSFTQSPLAVQPGDETSFPWLSSIALSFERYRFRRLRYDYRSTSATAISSANPALGVVGLVTNYDRLDAAFSTKQQAESYEGCVSTVPSVDCSHSVDVRLNSATMRNLFVRGGTTALPPGDLRLYDLATFTVFTDGAQAGANHAVVGELWVDYEIELYQPRMPIPLGAETDTWIGVNNAITDQTNLFKDVVIDGDNSLGLVLNTTNGMAFSLPGRYMVSVTFSGTSGIFAPGTGSGWTFTGSVGFAPSSGLAPGASASAVTDNFHKPSGGAQDNVQWCIVDVAGPGAVVSINAPSSLPVAARAIFFVSRIPSNIAY